MLYQTVAGTFMPYSKEEQDKAVKKYLDNVQLSPDSKKIKAIIVPHAGYIYSGQVAAYGYKQLMDCNADNVILVGPSHREYHRNIFEEIGDHSVEVQVPFIRNVLPVAKIMPMVYGDIDYEILAREINNKFDKTSVIVVSSDLSHYYPYEEAVRIDSQANKYIPTINIKKAEKEVEACGITGILALLKIAGSNNWKGKLLQYKNSGDTAGDKSAVVGYGCYGFYEE